ncbi:F-box protein SKIP19 [Brachypodium distachyon]|uniref:F-box protein SKIP19 n=1 Tax=Brachypodium distachyon TaxID=15368 RepID=UPI00052FE0CD|nr:F-box protein SKIP19 [Brachypodium distachyon]|eukprot:XP_010237170.1 F-box protein SKIP19 [Brachypodium distachyon]
METARDWSSGLPVDVLAAIFGNFSVHDILTGAGLVCRSWSGAAKLPGLWRSVDMSRMPYEHLFNPGRVFMCRMAMVAVRRAAGRLEAFAGWVFVTDELPLLHGRKVAVSSEPQSHRLRRRD